MDPKEAVIPSAPCKFYVAMHSDWSVLDGFSMHAQCASVHTSGLEMKWCSRHLFLHMYTHQSAALQAD